MSKLSKLAPQPLWHIFAKICSIPHSSHHEEELAEYIIHWANTKRLHTERDHIGNVLIHKSATAGIKNYKTVVLQAHLDMVAQKDNETMHDFIKDPIRPYIDDDWVKARGTTLGADNGIGIASILGILTSNTIEHGPLEVLLTTTEEVNMGGASNLQPDWIKGEMLINTDSEKEDTIYVGCAGGANFIFEIPISHESIPKGFHFFKLTLKGLRGGHSGTDIHLGLGNANKLLARFLAGYGKKLNLRLADFQGGTLHNVIPTEACIIIAITRDKIELLKKLIDKYLVILNKEIVKKEKNLTIVLEAVPNVRITLTSQSGDNFIQLLNAIPNGVIRNSHIAKGVVETSLNVGIVTIGENSAKITCLLRSLTNNGKEYIINILESLGVLAHAKTIVKDSYPCWQPSINSPLTMLTHKIYSRLFNRNPKISVIHAGLECGLFKAACPDIDMISIGPTIINPHSPREKVHIGSVANYWVLLIELLKAITVK